MNVIKRVISSPDQIGRSTHAKICKTSSQHKENGMSHVCNSPVGANRTNEPTSVDTSIDTESSVASQNKLVASTMRDIYSITISDDEASSGPIMEGNCSSNNNPKEVLAPLAISNRTSLESSFDSKNRSSESTSRSDSTGDTAGMKDWGWFEDMHDDQDGSTQMTDGNDKEDNMKKRMKGGFIDDGKATSCGYDIEPDAVVSSCMDDDTQMNEIEDMSTTSGRVGEKRKGKKKKEKDARVGV